MESLDDIPLKEDYVVSERENFIMNEYFGQPNEKESSNISWSSAMKISGYGIVLFSILANPWINQLLYKIPYVSNNPINAFCLKFFIFSFMILLITKYTS